MLTYQIRPRVFKIKPESEPRFPCDCEISFVFRPEQPFGEKPDGGKTMVKGAKCRILINGNTGESTTLLDPGLSPLLIDITANGYKGKLNGTRFIIQGHIDSRLELEERIDNVFYTLPTLLGIVFADPPFIVRVEGKIGEHSFAWELEEQKLLTFTTTQEIQIERFAISWKRMYVVAAPNRRRLLAALHYFYVACRLARSGATAGEFVAEVLLNLCKALETLFPAAKGVETRDAVRNGLKDLGYAEEDIETKFLPAMALRSSIDVGHVQLGVFTMDELRTLHRYADYAEQSFRQLFQDMFDKIEKKNFEVAPYEAGPVSQGCKKIIERLKQNLQQHQGFAPG